MCYIETLYVKEKKKDMLNEYSKNYKKSIIDKYERKILLLTGVVKGIKTQAEITINKMTKISNITTVNQARSGKNYIIALILYMLCSLTTAFKQLSLGGSTEN